MTSPSIPRVFLRRRLVLHSELGGELTLDGNDEVVGTASWVPVKEIHNQLGYKRILHGEISIPPNVLPSFRFARLELCVSFQSYEITRLLTYLVTSL